MVYNIYPAVDNGTYQFPPIVRSALAISPELRNTIVPMAEVDRNDLAGADLWPDRFVFNTDTGKINRYDAVALLWREIDSDNKVLRAGDTMTGPLTLSGAPTQNLHASTKKYVDDTDTTRKTYVDTEVALNRRSRNRIINGDFSINQRSLTSTTAAGYGFDRWVFGLSGGTVTHSAQTPALGDLPESARAFARVVTSGQSAVSDMAYLAQKIESVRTLSGKTITISFWAKAGSGTPKIAIELLQYFGSGGSPSGTLMFYVGQVTLNTTWTRYTVSYSVPSIVGKTIGTNFDDHLQLQFWTSAGSNYSSRAGTLGIQNATIDFWGVQVEEGASATPFEQKSYGEELLACQRYYYRIANKQSNTGTAIIDRMHCNSTGQPVLDVRHPIQMRIGPSCYGSGSDIQVQSYSGGTVLATAVGSPSTSHSTPWMTRVIFSGYTGTAGAHVYAYWINNTGWLELTAEL